MMIQLPPYNSSSAPAPSSSLGSLFGNNVLAFASLGIAVGAGFLALTSLAGPLQAFVGILGLFISGLILLHPEIGFLLMIALIPLDRIGRLSSSEAVIALSAAKILGMLTLAGWLLHTFSKKEKIIFPREFLPLILFILLGSLTYFYTTDKPAAAAAISRLLTTLFLLFLTVNIVKPNKHLKLTIASLLVMTAVMGVFAVSVRFFPAYVTREEGTVLDSYGVMEDPAEEARVGVIKSSQGATVHPGFYVLNLLIAIPLYIYMFQDTASLFMKFLWGGSGGLATVNLFLTYRRSGIVFLIVILVFMLAKRLIKITPAALILGALSVSIALFFMPETFWTRVLSPSAYSIEKAHNVKSRLEMWEAAFMLIKDNWLFGVGLFNQIELPKYNNLSKLTGVHSGAHNAYLQLWIETGILGLLLFLYILYTFWRDLSVAEKNFSRLSDQPMYKLVGFLKTVFLVPLLLGLTGVDWNIPMREWWFICGVAVVMRRYSENLSLASTE
jgi:hypothetical protein